MFWWSCFLATQKCLFALSHTTRKKKIMKINKLVLAVTTALLVQPAMASNAPKSQLENQAHHHGIEKKRQLNVPTAQTQTRSNPLEYSHRLHDLNLQTAVSEQALAATCDLNAFNTTNSTSLINTIKAQGASCVNDLFSASSNIQASAFTSNHMFAVANHVKSLAHNYNGGGDSDIEALFLYLRAGYFVEFYNDGVSFATWVKPAVKGAIDAFVNNSHFYDNNEGHAKTMTEVITTMDSSEQQDVYLPIAKAWLSRWNETYAAGWNMRGAINGFFTLIFRGQWNSNFVANIGSDKELVAILKNFAMSSYMLGTDAEFMVANAARELGRLKTYSGTAIQADVDAALKHIFTTYEMFGYGDVVWLGAADTATYYADCSEFNICGYGAQLIAKVFPQNHQCSSTIRIRSQDMSAIQLTAACNKMGYEETFFHTQLQTNQISVADDYNSQLQVNIFNSSDDYGKYGGAIFGIDTNNGGMYLEGNPADQTNVPNFIAYEASYANADHFVWNLEHEYVHYLDGRFDLYGDFNNPTERTVWWTEGVAEYVANQNNNPAAIATINDGSTYSLSTVFETTYDGFDQDRIYRWGYLAVRFMFEKHRDEVNLMLADTRKGDWTAYKARVNTWGSSYGAEFTSWTLTLTDDTNPPVENKVPFAVHNGPYAADENVSIQFDGSGSYDQDGTIVSYLWDFGDNSTSSEAQPSHSYAQAGDYTVTLTVKDDKGAVATATSQASISSDVIEPPVGNALQNKQPLNISGAQDQQSNFTFAVPAGASELNFKLAGGQGDADLYVKFAEQATVDVYDCRPYIGGNNETCTIENAQAGTYHVMVRGYNAYETTLTASFTASPNTRLPNVCATQAPVSGGQLEAGKVICLAQQEPMWFSIADVNGHSTMSITSANGTGDLTLEYSNATWPNGVNHHGSSNNVGNSECITLNAQANYWGYLKVSGAAQGVAIVVDFDTPGCR